MEYEFGMTLTNHRLDPEVETVFLMAGAEYSHVSSTLVKQVAYFGGFEEVRKLVPEPLVGPRQVAPSSPDPVANRGVDRRGPGSRAPRRVAE